MKSTPFFPEKTTFSPEGAATSGREESLDEQCVALGAQIPILEDRSDIGRRHQVLEVAVGAAYLVYLGLQLLVDGG